MHRHKARIGIIGVGLMGHGIACNIARAGWPLRYLRHPGNQPTADLQTLGGVGMDDRQALVRDCDVLILCVTGSPQVEDILLTEQTGVLAAMRPGTVIVDCSTAIPESTQYIAQQVHNRGGHFLDAAMTRTPAEAARGRLNLIVGAEAQDLADWRPLFEAFAENIFHAGPVSAGHRMKLLHNFISLGFAAVIGEASACAESAGIDKHAFVEVLSQGAAGGVVFDRMRPYILEQDPSRFDFSLANASKDIGYYCQMVKDMGGAHQVADGVCRAYQSLVDQGHAQASVPEQIDYYQDNNHVSG